MKFVMTAEIALSRVAGKQVCSKHIDKNTLTWFEGSKSVPLRGKMTTEGSSVHLGRDEKRRSKAS